MPVSWKSGRRSFLPRCWTDFPALVADIGTGRASRSFARAAPFFRLRLLRPPILAPAIRAGRLVLYEGVELLFATVTLVMIDFALLQNFSPETVGFSRQRKGVLLSILECFLLTSQKLLPNLIA